MNKLSAIALLSGIALAQPSTTVVEDTIVTNPGAQPVFGGNLHITWPKFTYDSFTIPSSSLDYPINNGVLNLSLVPVDHSQNPAVYTVQTTIAGITGPATYWKVLTSGTPLSLEQVTVDYAPGPNVNINAAQIVAAGSTTGKCLVYNGTIYAPASCGSPLGPYGVVSAGGTFPNLTATLSNPNLPLVDGMSIWVPPALFNLTGCDGITPLNLVVNGGITALIVNAFGSSPTPSLCNTMAQQWIQLTLYVGESEWFVQTPDLGEVVNIIQSNQSLFCDASSGGLGVDYACDLGLTEYTDGMVVWFRPDVIDTALPTLNISGLGSRDIATVGAFLGYGCFGEYVSGPSLALTFNNIVDEWFPDPSSPCFTGVQADPFAGPTPGVSMAFIQPSTHYFGLGFGPMMDLEASVTLRPSDITSLTTVPFTLVPAQGSGTLIENPSCFMNLTGNGTPYTGSSLPIIGVGTVTKMMPYMIEVGLSEGITDAANKAYALSPAQDTAFQALGSAAPSVPSVNSSDTLNQPLVLAVFGSDYAGGTGSLAVTCRYRVRSGLN